MVQLFNWFGEQGVQDLISMIYSLLDIIRIVVPIGLILMTSLDISKKVINPEDKEGQKKIMIRAIAALVVFLLPTIINIIMKIGNINQVDIDTTMPTYSPVITVKPTIKPTVRPTLTPRATPTVRPTLTPIATPTTRPTLSSVSIINCPKYEEKYFIGDKVTLKTNIPTSFNGNIKWKVNDTSVATIVDSSKGTEATIQLLTKSKLGSVWVTVIADGQVDTCAINIEVVKELKIENCPSDTTIFHVGDSFVLKSNLPSTYQGVIVWTNNSSPSPFRITPSSDEKEARVEIVSVPKDNYSFVGLGADSKATVCKINIE